MLALAWTEYRERWVSCDPLLSEWQHEQSGQSSFYANPIIQSVDRRSPIFMINEQGKHGFHYMISLRNVFFCMDQSFWFVYDKVFEIALHGQCTPL